MHVPVVESHTPCKHARGDGPGLGRSEAELGASAQLNARADQRTLFEHSTYEWGSESEPPTHALPYLHLPAWSGGEASWGEEIPGQRLGGVRSNACRHCLCPGLLLSVPLSRRKRPRKSSESGQGRAAGRARTHAGRSPVR
jgi:hypothetical protein